MKSTINFLTSSKVPQDTSSNSNFQEMLPWPGVTFGQRQDSEDPRDQIQGMLGIVLSVPFGVWFKHDLGGLG